MGILAILCSAAEAQSAPSAREIVRAREILVLTMRREELLERNRSFLLPAVGVGTGVAMLVVGGVVFSQAWGGTSSFCSTNSGCTTTDSYNERLDRTGLVMMPLGAALIVINTPLFAIRLSRARRLERATRRLELLGKELTLGASPAGKGLSARLSF